MTIEGVNGREAANVRNLLGIHAYHRQNAPGASRVRFLHNRAERDIFRALTPYGYYRIEIDSSPRTARWRLACALPHSTWATDSNWPSKHRVSGGLRRMTRSLRNCVSH